MLGTKMLPTRCPRCGLSAYDDPSYLFGSAHLVVSDGDCSYFVEGKEYFLKCEYVRGGRDGLFSTTANPCPSIKNALTSEWRLGASAQSDNCHASAAVAARGNFKIRSFSEQSTRLPSKVGSSYQRRSSGTRHTYYSHDPLGSSVYKSLTLFYLSGRLPV